MTTAYSTLLGLALPVTGELSGTWGDTVDNGITRYLDIAVAGTVTLTNDGAVTLSLTNGDASATNIVSSLTGAGTVTAQFALIRVTGTLTVAKVLTAPSSSRTYVVVNAATGSTVTVKASGQTGVSIAVGETAFVYFNGTDYAKIVGTATAGAAGGSTTQVQFNSSGVLAGSANMTFNGTKLTVAGLLDSALTSGRVPYATTSGEFTDSANLLYSGTDLTVYGITVGRGAGAVSTNTAVGASALAANTSGARNVAVGISSLNANTTGSQNSALGDYSMLLNTTGGYNSAIGDYVMEKNTTGSYNAAFGGSALASNTTASNNTAVGYQAGYSNQTASYLTFIGYQAGYSTTSNVNLAIGYQALYSNTSGDNNTAVGDYRPLYANTTGASNIAIGRESLTTNTTGSYNIAIGRQALQANTTASNNTAVGYQAGYSQTSPASGKNAYFGYQAGYANVTSDFNTYIGNFAGGNATSSNNTFVGSGAGYLVTSGAKNSIFGNYNGNQGSLDIRTASNYIVLSDGDGNPLISTNSTRSVALNGATPQTGTGITFPATQSASSDANTLDDYEEGAWSPTLTSAGGNFTTLAYGDQQGTYTRIGREVTVRGNLYTSGAITAGSASGQVYIAGLPFAASVSNLGQIWTSPDTANYNSPLALATGVQVNSSTLRMYKNGTVNNSNFNVTDLYTVGGPSNNIYFQATYFV